MAASAPLRRFAHLNEDLPAHQQTTQLLRQGDAKVFKKYSQNEVADEAGGAAKAQSISERVERRSDTEGVSRHVLGQFRDSYR